MIAAALAFVLGPVGRWVAIGGLALTVLIGAYTRGHMDGTARCEAAVAKAVAAEVQRQAAAGNAALEAARKQAEKSAIENDALQAKVDAYVEELAKRVSPVECRLSDADARRLRDIK